MAAAQCWRSTSFPARHRGPRCPMGPLGTTPSPSPAQLAFTGSPVRAKFAGRLAVVDGPARSRLAPSLLLCAPGSCKWPSIPPTIVRSTSRSPVRLLTRSWTAGGREGPPLPASRTLACGAPRCTAIRFWLRTPSYLLRVGLPPESAPRSHAGAHEQDGCLKGDVSCRRSLTGRTGDPRDPAHRVQGDDDQHG